MNYRFNYFFILFLTFCFVGCVSKTVKQEGTYKSAQWETKALIKDQKNNKTQSLNIDIYAVKDERARFEISALMGFQVASLVMTPAEIAYAIHPKKTYYSGKNSDNAFYRVVGMPLHPMNLTNIAFDEPIDGVGWSCLKNSAGLVYQCENSRKKIHIEWSARNQGQKKVVITAPQFEMQWLFSSPRTQVEFKSEIFTLNRPSGFKAIQIN